MSPLDIQKIRSLGLGLGLELRLRVFQVYTTTYFFNPDECRMISTGPGRPVDSTSERRGRKKKEERSQVLKSIGIQLARDVVQTPTYSSLPLSSEWTLKFIAQCHYPDVPRELRLINSCYSGATADDVLESIYPSSRTRGEFPVCIASSCWIESMYYIHHTVLHQFIYTAACSAT